MFPPPHMPQSTSESGTKGPDVAKFTGHFCAPWPLNSTAGCSTLLKRLLALAALTHLQHGLQGCPFSVSFTGFSSFFLPRAVSRSASPSIYPPMWPDQSPGPHQISFLPHLLCLAMLAVSVPENLQCVLKSPKDFWIINSFSQQCASPRSSCDCLPAFLLILKFLLEYSCFTFFKKIEI